MNLNQVKMQLVRKLTKWLIVGGVAIALSLESFSRLIGLGSPALSIEHPTIEYMFRPNQDVQRFGNRFLTNAWGMRSDPFPRRKLDSSEYRVLVLGDSVINGGNLTDHSELATTLVQDNLAAKWGFPVIVANASAGSWGPGNWLAYVQEFGTFDADHVVIVANGGDSRDAPTFSKLNPNTHPTEKPWFATQELFSRYLPRYLPFLRRTDPVASDTASDDESTRVRLYAVCRDDLVELIRIFQTANVPVDLIKYASRAEVENGLEDEGLLKLDDLFAEYGIAAHSTLPYFDKSQVPTLFRDGIHPNPPGQKEIAKLLQKVIEEARMRRERE